MYQERISYAGAKSLLLGVDNAHDAHCQRGTERADRGLARMVATTAGSTTDPRHCVHHLSPVENISMEDTYVAQGSTYELSNTPT